jgi:hypothetical protein
MSCLKQLNLPFSSPDPKANIMPAKRPIAKIQKITSLGNFLFQRINFAKKSMTYTSLLSASILNSAELTYLDRATRIKFWKKQMNIISFSILTLLKDNENSKNNI